MSISNNKYYVGALRVIVVGLLLFLLVAFYSFSILAKEQIFALYFIFIIYFELVFLFIIFIGSFRRFEKYYNYLILLSPLLLTFVFTYTVSKNFNLDTQEAMLLSLITYGLILILTKCIVDFFSINLNIMLLGKDSNKCIGDDHRCISIYTENEDQLPFIKNIINNVLGYSNEIVKTLVLNETEYEIFEFKKHISQPLINHLILIPISDVDERLYNGFFIYQYHEDEDQLYQGTSFDDVYLVFANLLTDHDKKLCFDENYIPIYDTPNYKNKDTNSVTLLHKYIVTYYKKDDIASIELFTLRDKLCQTYLDQKYKSLIDRIYKGISGMLKKKHTKTILCLTLLILISIGTMYGIYAYTNDIIQTIIVIFGIPAGLYSTVSLYDRFFKK